MISIEQKAPPGDRIAAEWNDVANATRRRRRILQSRILFYSTGKFDGTSLLNKKALRANDAHSREDEDRRERPRSARECAEAHSFLLYRIRVSKDTLTFIDFCLYLENLTRIDFRIGYLENLQNASLVFFILIMLSLFWQHNEPSNFHNPIAF